MYKCTKTNLLSKKLFLSTCCYVVVNVKTYATYQMNIKFSYKDIKYSVVVLDP